MNPKNHEREKDESRKNDDSIGFPAVHHSRDMDNDGGKDTSRKLDREQGAGNEHGSHTEKTQQEMERFGECGRLNFGGLYMHAGMYTHT